MTPKTVQDGFWVSQILECRRFQIKGVTVDQVEKQFGAFSAILEAILATRMLAILDIPGYSKPLGVLLKQFQLWKGMPYAPRVAEIARIGLKMS